jgi:hypothetical protein
MYFNIVSIEEPIMEPNIEDLKCHRGGDNCNGHLVSVRPRNGAEYAESFGGELVGQDSKSADTKLLDIKEWDAPENRIPKDGDNQQSREWVMHGGHAETYRPQMVRSAARNHYPDHGQR